MTAPETGIKTAGRATTPVRRNLEQRLLAYAAAASASFLTVQPAAAKVIYTPMNLTIETGIVPLDLNQDGVVDFNLVERGVNEGAIHSRGLNLNGAGSPGAAVVTTSLGGASALRFGAMIGPGGRFGEVQNGARVMAHLGITSIFGTYWGCYGAFKGSTRFCSYSSGVTDAFLGLRFVVSGKTYYGWAGFSVVKVGGLLSRMPYIHARLTGVAYEDVPGQSIRAGQTSGSADDPVFDGDSEVSSLAPEVRSSPQPVPQRIQPSLGVLSLGAQGIPLWRRRET